CINGVNTTLGGAGGALVCGPGQNVGGGRGGDGLCPGYGDFPQPAENGAPGGGSAGGVGGTAAWDLSFDSLNSCTSCIVPPGNMSFQPTFGFPGSAGTDGPKGSGCTTPAGEVINGHWVGLSGDNGATGTHGSGGGGGGAGAGVFINGSGCAPDVGSHDIGGTGGGGGSGGCSGTGGGGGSAGGGSFAVFVVASDPAQGYPTVVTNVLRSGTGGSGAAGGPGGSGGQAGSGSPGGPAADALLFSWCATGGGEGGNGGRGGHGGGGGGGCGGASYSIFAWPISDDPLLTSYKTQNTFLAGGQGGGPGPGGSSLGESGLPGATGEAEHTNL
ncbi:MAG: hypothetical protein VX938_13565, partial [Myxococcota bacterium]|nr:hypothetical protein [Myxococcota bacterium]